MTYHPTCHSLRLLKVGDAPVRLLRAVRGIDLVELPAAEQCCGFGGTFAVKNADTSTAMLTDKLRRILDTGADVCTAADNSCLMHIGGGLRHARAGVRVMHLAEILAMRGRVKDGFPRAARAALGRQPAAAQPRPRDDDDPRQARAGGGRGRPTGRRCATPAPRSRTARCATSTSTSSAWRRPSSAPAAPCTGRATAPRPRAVVADVARAHGSDEVIKVKSLATDEIDLNGRLEAVGVHAVETDLAELINQLSDDTSSHILVPAIHRNRAQIAALFRRELGVEVSDEPAELTAAARAHLRAKFLSVPVGVSGANFAVAETGHVVVLESEGNGRMCTTLPEVLVSVVGIEKVLPRWRDLEVMLQLLPRSSTGERMNPYTSIWSGRGRRRRPARVPPRPARRRAHRRAGRRGRARGAALHPLLGVPERVPGLRAHRRPRLRERLPGPDRRDPHARSCRASRTRRRCRGPARCAAPATRSAR